MKPHELKAIANHPVRQIFLAAARSTTPPRRSEIVKDCQDAGLSEEQTDRVIGLAGALVAERANGYGTFTLARTADQITLETLKAFGTADSLDGHHGLWHPHHDEDVDTVRSEEAASTITDPKATRIHQETVTFEDGSSARL